VLELNIARIVPHYDATIQQLYSLSESMNQELLASLSISLLYAYIRFRSHTKSPSTSSELIAAQKNVLVCNVLIKTLKQSTPNVDLKRMPHLALVHPYTHSDFSLSIPSVYSLRPFSSSLLFVPSLRPFLFVR
jgi:hypothetical protein